MSAELLPERVFSASHCSSELIPNNFHALNWEHYDEKRRREYGPKLGVEETRIPELVKWANEQWKSQQIGWGNVFYSADVARGFVDQFGLSGQDLVLFSIGLHRKYVSLFVEETRPPEKIIAPGIWWMVQKGVLAEAGGESIGHDVLGYELAWAHSWLCYGFEKQANSKLAIRSNKHGFLDTLEDAEKVAKLANDSDAPPENKPWLPWLVTIHSLAKSPRMES
jgi:hypothetical protein